MGVTAWAAGQQNTMHDHDDTICQTGFSGVPDSPVPTGCRIHRTEFDEARTAAISWSGREGGIDHWSLLSLLETDGVPEHFGLGHRHIDYIRAAFRKLQSSDFADGTWPPVVWITKKKLATKLRVSPRTVSSIEQDLARAGFIYWLDTASRRRDGRRCPRTGRIMWAYGINFAPMAELVDCIEAITTAAEADSIEADGLRHEIATIRCHAVIRLQGAIRSGRASAPDAEPVHAALRSLPTAKRMAGTDLDTLRSLVRDARRLEQAATALSEPIQPEANQMVPDLASSDDGPSEAGKGSNKNCTLGYPSATRSNSNSNQYIDNNLAAPAPDNRDTATHRDAVARPSPERKDCSGDHSLEATPSNAPPAWLILDSLSPRLARYLPENRHPTTDEFVNAANWTRSELGISPSAWGQACRALTPVAAALAIVVIAGRYDAGAIRSPGGYLRAMVDSARQGKLNLGAALWGTVDLAQRPPRAPSSDDLRHRQASRPAPDSNTSPAAPDDLTTVARDRRRPRAEYVLRESGHTHSSRDLSR